MPKRGAPAINAESKDKKVVFDFGNAIVEAKNELVERRRKLSKREEKLEELQHELKLLTDMLSADKRQAYLAVFKAELDVEELKLEVETWTLKVDLLQSGKHPTENDRFVSLSETNDTLRSERRTRIAAYENKLGQDFPDPPPPRLEPVGEPIFPQLPGDWELKFSSTGEFDLDYVDDSNRLAKVVQHLEELRLECGKPRASDRRAPIVTGHPGIGKTRLGIEAAKAFVANAAPGARGLCKVSLMDKDFTDFIKHYVPKDEQSSSGTLLAATLIWAMSENERTGRNRMSPTSLFALSLDDVLNRAKARFPELDSVVLVIDEFSADLVISERLMSACGVVTATVRGPDGMYVLPMFTGVHRARVPRQMTDLLGMDQRPSGNMTTVLTIVTSLSFASRDKIVQNMAQKLYLPDGALKRALGRILNDCGGWPSFLNGLYLALLQSPEALEQIRRNGLLGTETGKALWDGMIDKFRGDFKLLRFAEIVSNEKIRKPLISPSERYAPERVRASGVVARELCVRLILLAMTGEPIDPTASIVVKEDFKGKGLSDDSPALAEIENFTYQMADRMIEIAKDPDDRFTYRVVMAILAIAALSESLHLSHLGRLLVNPYNTTPVILEILAVESLANVLRVHRLLKRDAIPVRKLREGARIYGNKALFLRVPIQECEVLLLIADHLAVMGINPEGVATGLEVKTESNGKGLPKPLRAGTCFINAVNEKAMDGGCMAEEFGTLDPVLILSQSKFVLDYVPQSGADGGEVNLTRGAAETILEGLRAQAEVLKRKLGYGANQRIHYVYDVFTTRQIGARLEEVESPFNLRETEVVLMTTRDCVAKAVGPTLSVRMSFPDE